MGTISRATNAYTQSSVYPRKSGEVFASRSGYLTGSHDRYASYAHTSASRLRTASNEVTNLDSGRLNTDSTLRVDYIRRLQDTKNDSGLGKSNLKNSSQAVNQNANYISEYDHNYRRNHRSSMLRESLSRQYVNQAIAKRVGQGRDEIRSPPNPKHESKQYYNILWNERSSLAVREKEKYCSEVLDRVHASKEKISRLAQGTTEAKTRTVSFHVENDGAELPDQNGLAKASEGLTKVGKKSEVKDVQRANLDMKEQVKIDIKGAEFMYEKKARPGFDISKIEKRAVEHDYPNLKFSSKFVGSDPNVYRQKITFNPYQRGSERVDQRLNNKSDANIVLGKTLVKESEPNLIPGESILIKRSKLSRLADKIDPMIGNSKSTQIEMMSFLKHNNYDSELIDELVRKLANYKCAYERCKLAKSLVDNPYDMKKKPNSGQNKRVYASPKRNTQSPQQPGDFLSLLDQSTEGRPRKQYGASSRQTKNFVFDKEKDIPQIKIPNKHSKEKRKGSRSVDLDKVLEGKNRIEEGREDEDIMEELNKGVNQV